MSDQNPPLDVPRLPWEGGNETSVEAAEEALASLVPPPPGDGDTQEDSEPEAPEGAEESDEDEEDDAPEGDESEESEDDESEEDEDADDSDEEPDNTVTVKVDGEEVQVTLDELKKGYSRTADYTRKTQELAKQRKALEAELTSTAEVRTEYATSLAYARKFIESMGPKKRTAAEWDALRAQDPATFNQEWAAYQFQKEQMTQVAAEEQKLQEAALADYQKQTKALMEREHEALVVAVPEWQDADKAAEEKAELARFAVNELGFTQEQMANVTDHRLVLLLRDAYLYRQAQSKGKAKLEEARKSTKVLKPGGRPRKTASKSKRVRERKQALARSGSMEAAVDVLMEMDG